MFHYQAFSKKALNFSTRAFSFFGKVTLSSIKKEMQPLVQRACEDTAAQVCRNLFYI